MSEFRITTNREGSRSFAGRGGNNRGGRGGRGGQGGYDNNRGSRDYSGGGGSYGSYSSGRGGRNPYVYKSRPRRQSGSQYRSRLPHSDGVTPLSRLGDDDDEMGDEEGKKQPVPRYKPYGGRPQSRNARRGRAGMDSSSRGALKRLGLPVNRDRRDGGEPQRWKIIIPHGRSCDKAFIVNSITQMINMPFVADQFHHEANSAVFFVDSHQTAQAIAGISKQITKKDGYKMLILMQRGGSAPVPLNEDTLTKLKVCMSKRYDPATKTLNLEKLYYDTDLSNEGIHMVLSRRIIMSAVITIIKENIPELASLGLSNNKLYNIDLMSTLHQAAPDLVRLDLGDNVIRSSAYLSSLEGMNLVELRLAGNPLCDTFSDDAAYVSRRCESGEPSVLMGWSPVLTYMSLGLVSQSDHSTLYCRSALRVYSAVRKRLPKLMRLDGRDLPPPITFDIEEITKLPPTKGSFFLNDQVKGLICTFLQQYYMIYDSSNRNALLDAYHEQVTFSMIYMYNRGQCRDQHDFSAYHRDSRNLKKLTDSARRQKNLRCGKASVVSLLSELPVTRHDPASYVIDVNLASPTMLNFTVHGVFEEVAGKTKGTLRAFSRLFIAVPQGSGVAIINEELFLTNPTAKQQENAFKTPAAVPTPNPTPGGSTVLPGTTPGVAAVMTTDAQKEAMIQQFSVQSGMNNDWAKMCLLQNEWNFEKAAQVFADLRAKGGIPPEAFVK